MDSLALLCNLHADGPATLGLLRRAGCQSLADLQRLTPENLAELLQVPPAMARRLNREARLLADRVGEDPLDPEEAPEGVAIPLAERDPAPSLGSAQAAVEHLRPIERQIVDQAVSRQPGFRTHPEEANGRPERSNGAEDAWQWNDGPSESAPVAQPMAEGVPATPPPALAPQPHPGAALIGAVDGLDRVVAGALAAAGVNSIEDLIDRDAGPLARQTGLNFSRVRRFQFLARRALLAEPEAAPAPRSEPLPPRESIALEPRPVEFPTVTPAESQAVDPAEAPAETPPETVPGPPSVELPKFTPRHDVATPFGAPLMPTELQGPAEEPIHLPAESRERSVETVQEAPEVSLPDHPVAEFEPQSGGPMVAPQALDVPWRPEELIGSQDTMEADQGPAQAAPQEPSAGEEGPMVETPVTPLGRWVPRALRGVEETPIECVEPEPVLVPPPPPRRFWEPKRFWEARKNRREKAALEARGETENLPEQELGQATDRMSATQEGLEARGTADPVEPAAGALPWDFAGAQEAPAAQAKGSGAAHRFSNPSFRTASLDEELPHDGVQGSRGKGFEFPDAQPKKEATREDASGPFA